MSDPLTPEARKGIVQKGPYLNGTLPPMSSLEDIFADLAGKAKEKNLATVIEALDGRSLRVATVCSGTEAPILALELIAKALEGEMPLQFSQQFGCEIDPLKQSFIERNFKPALLFRDLTELAGDKSTTAYGSIEKIPRGIDLLIAGTSCVDFSNLNNKKKTQQEAGESVATFKGLQDYATRHRPRIIVCENVKGADWKKHVESWERIGYATKHLFIDTKEFYVPQTRQRGYSVSVDRYYLEKLGLEDKAEKIVKYAIELIDDFKRPCSSPASSFLIDALDLAYEKVETDIVTKGGIPQFKDTAWEKYQERHQDLRDKEQLGPGRPISRSVPGEPGTCKWPDFYDRKRAKADLEVERVAETIDIKHLEAILREYDTRYKERYQDNSQGVDRGSVGPNSFGVSCCVTPCGLLFCSNTGRQLSGFDGLVLQGMPVNRIMLGNEKERDLQSLAGNAMTTTVVGAVMLAALIAGADLLGPHNDLALDDTSSEAAQKPLAEIEEGHILHPIQSDQSEQSEHCEDLSSTILKQADGASRLCYCENQTRIATGVMLVCADCGDTVCSDCSGNPDHNHTALTFDGTRMPPDDFRKMLKQVIPMRLTIDNIPEGFFVPQTPAVLNDKNFKEIANAYYEIVNRAKGTKFFFADIKRSQIWTAHYESDSGQFSLHLEIENGQAKWFLYAQAPKNEPSKSVLRAALEQPIAKLSLSKKGALLPTSSDAWEAIEPISNVVEITVGYHGVKVPGYGARCGIENEKATKYHVASELHISMGAEESKKLEIDVSGIYRHLPDCGTSNDGLYKKEGPKDQHPIFLFLDPGKLSLPNDDPYVFAFEHRRIHGRTARRTIMELDPIWTCEAETEPPAGKDSAASENVDDEVESSSEHSDPDYEVDEDNGGATSTRKRQGETLKSPRPSKQQKIEETLKATPKVVTSGSDELEKVTWAPETIVGWVRCSHKANNKYSETDRLCINPIVDADVSVKVLGDPSSLTLRDNHCHLTHIPILQLSLPSSLLNLDQPISSENTLIKSEKVSSVVQKIHWALQGTAHLSTFESWQPLKTETVIQSPIQICQTCNPPPPSFIWKIPPNYDPQSGHEPRLTPCENPREAATWERLIKQKPSVFEVFVREEDPTQHTELSIPAEETGKKTVTFTINLQSMAHTAIGNLTTMDNTNLRFTQLNWRLIQEANDAGRRPLPPFTIRDSSHEDEGPQPPIFILNLRPDQLRSVSWMKAQEAEDIQPWDEKEIVEATLPDVSWRVEVKTTAQKTIRGGLCAEQVGYGKTACILGLFDSLFEQDRARIDYSCGHLTEDGLIKSHATLLIVPIHLVKQWQDEIEKFLGDRYTVLALPTITYLQKVTIQQIVDADIIVASASIMGNTSYNEKLSLFTGYSDAPNSGKARAGEEWLDKVIGYLKAGVRLGIEEGVQAWLDDALQSHQEMQRFKADATYQPSQRLRGAKFAEHKRAKAKPEASTAEPEVSSSAANQPDALSIMRKKFKIAGKVQNFGSLTAAFLHCFRFTRVVSDEFTYLNNEAQFAVQRLSARSKWIVSGTPALRDFADIKTIAGFIGAHLGIDNDGNAPTENDRLKRSKNNMTGAEKFQQAQPPKSNEWYLNRQQHAQDFLNQFARRNLTILVDVELRERPLCRKLEVRQQKVYDHLRKSLLDNVENPKAYSAARPDELTSIAANSILQLCHDGGAPEALSRACISFRTQHKMIDEPFKKRVKNLEEIELSRFDFFVMAWEYYFDNLRDPNEGVERMAETFSLYKGFPLAMESISDSEVLNALAVRAENLWHQETEKDWTNPDTDIAKRLAADWDYRLVKAGATKTVRENGGAPLTSAKVKVLRQYRLDLEVQVRFCCSAWNRSRLIEAAYQLQVGGKLECDGCKKLLPTQDVVLLLCCHHFCPPCIEECKSTDGSVPKCKFPGCGIPFLRDEPLTGHHLTFPNKGFSEPENAGRPKINGRMHDLFRILECVPKEMQGIIFVQQHDMMDYVATQLKNNGVTCTIAIPKNKTAVSSFIEGSKGQGSKKRILILELGSEMGAGLNLQCAGFVVFFAPYISDSQQRYEACMAQAIGRIFRHGQEAKEVFAWHLAAAGTNELSILEYRRGQEVVVRDGKAKFIAKGSFNEKTDRRITPAMMEPRFIAYDLENPQN